MLYGVHLIKYYLAPIYLLYHQRLTYYPMHLITTYRTEKGPGRGTGARHKRQGTSKTYILGISQRMHVYIIKIVLE